MSIEVRPATPEDWGLVQRLDERAFGFSATHDRELERRIFELDRTVFGRADGQDIGLASIYSLKMSVPGGSLVDTAGVTWVGVLATHRRQGVGTAMMRRLVDDAHARGTEPVMALWALDPGIYGRYGFGIASRSFTCTIPTHRSALPFAGPPDPTYTVRLADPQDVRDDIATIADRVVAHRPGGIPRATPWWDLHLQDLPDSRDGASASRALIVDGPDGPQAFARFRTKMDFERPVPGGVLRVSEVGYADPRAAALLWRTLLGHDIVTTVEYWNLPCDDPLLTFLGDARSAEPTLSDRLHIRLIDVPRALEARTYAAPIDVVFELEDPFAPWCSGRYRLAGGPGGATCTATTDAADFALGASDLGAIYLGGTRVSVLADAGRVRELAPGSVASASAAFLGTREAWCPFVF